MEVVAIIALVLYLALVLCTAVLIRRRAPSRSLWIAFIPGVNVLALADLTGITHSHRFDETRNLSTKTELDHNTARNSTQYWR